MINTFSSKIISLDGAALHLKEITGKTFNRATFLRWINRGIGGVKLEAIRIGNQLFTSQEALTEFLNLARVSKSRKHSAVTRAGISKTLRTVKDAYT